MLSSRRKFLSQAVALCASTSAAPFLIGCQQRQRAKVIVIGAGLAGLNSARILQNQGWDPVILEASNEAGGRTLSKQIGGQTIDMGGIEIGDGYDRFISLATELGLEFYSPPRSEGGLSIYHNEQLVDAKNWGDFASNPLPEEVRATLPSRLEFGFHAKDFPLTNTTDWLDKKYNKYDIPESQRLRELGADQAAIELINRAGNFNHIDQVSALHVLRAYAGFKFGTSKKTVRLSGGNQQLGLAMSQQQQNLLTNHVVTRIADTTQGVEIDCSNGKRWLAEHAVIALPFSVLRKIDLQANLPVQQRQAINQLSYTNISKLVARVDKPFWEQDGLPASMWCNSALERCFLSKGENGEPLLTVFINGAGTGVIDSQSDEQASQWILKELVQTRPSTKGALTPLVFISWANNRFAQGAYHAFAPGQITRFANEMVLPAGRLSFAGEHCARAFVGMEGALESGEIAANQLLNR